MIYLTRYLLKHYIRSQKYVAPVIFYIITMLLIYSYKPNPVADSYSVTAMLLFFGADWLGLTVLNTEPAGQYQLLVLHAGSKRKVVFAQLICAYHAVRPDCNYRVISGCYGHVWEATEYWRVDHGLGRTFGVVALGAGAQCFLPKIIHSHAEPQHASFHCDDVIIVCPRFIKRTFA